jgi:hypothetical protein
MRLCAFCPSPATKKGEHIFDDWLNSDEDGKTIRRKYLIESEGRASSNALSYRTGRINITRPVVCIPCNNEWMSDLTNEAKTVAEAMIRHGRPTALEPIDIVTLAAYGFMKGVVVDYSITLDGHRPFFKPSARYRFKEELTIPEGTQIWLGHHKQRGHLTSGHAWSHTLQLYSGIVKGFNFYVFTYMVGHLVIQVSVPQWGKRSARPADGYPVLEEAPGWRAYTVAIWPDVSFAHWPPQQEMDRQRLETFRYRFRNLQAPVRRR